MEILERHFDVQTGIETVNKRQETEAEIAERERIDAERLELLAVIEAKELARLAILEKLGLTADDIAALGL
jgi:hypothetical protein